MKQFSGFLLLLVMTIGLAQADGKVNDFDKICQVYTETSQQDSFKTLSASERANYINQKIEETVQPGETLDALHLIAQADPKEKYSLLKQVAEMSTGKPWDCPAIKNANLSY